MSPGCSQTSHPLVRYQLGWQTGTGYPALWSLIVPAEIYNENKAMSVGHRIPLIIGQFQRNWRGIQTTFHCLNTTLQDGQIFILQNFIEISCKTTCFIDPSCYCEKMYNSILVIAIQKIVTDEAKMLTFFQVGCFRVELLWKYKDCNFLFWVYLIYDDPP